MVAHRFRITRIIAAALAFALSTEVADAQIMGCATMSGGYANGHQSAMMRHEHRTRDDAAGATSQSSSHNTGSSTAGCNLNALCATAAAISNPTTHSAGFGSTERPISSGAGVLRVRTLCPDPPPPRI
jgi:hypothetical protein